jgi:ornithine cyclodeaminase/alanine dehydrogenase-like protein (mu-crystallin family)
MPDGRRTLRYLSAMDVEALMPPVLERIALARRAMLALVADAELPSKLGVHPRGPDSFAHAMPALLRGADESGSGDLVGMKWVVGFPDNRRRGLPAIHGTVLLNDPTTGVPLSMLDAGAITAHRTAAVSGVAIARWARSIADRPLRVAMLGAGVQARSHLPVVAHLLPGSRLTVHDRNRDRAEAVAVEAAAGARFAGTGTASDPIEAIRDADVVLTLVSFGPDRQSLPADAFRSDALVVAVDYDMSVPASLASEAALFLVDEIGQFRANRGAGLFAGYPDPAGIIGEWLEPQAPVEGLPEGFPAPDGRVLVTHLGVGLADLVFADALLRAAEQRGVGVELP